MSTLPDRIDLPTPRVKLALIAALLVVMAIVCIAVADKIGWFGWLIAAAQGALALVFVLGIFHGVGLSLDREGFTVHSLWSSEKRYLWKDVSAFQIGMRGRARAIRFDDATRHDAMSDMRHSIGRTNSWVSPLVVSGGLRNACALLNAFRERARG